MSGKIVTFNPEAREKLVKGVNTVANAVAVTLGPKGRNVVIDTYGVPAVTKDGVTVAKYITLNDPVENLGAQIIKQAASKSGTNAGDGTTTATVIAQALVQGAMDLIRDGKSPIDIKRDFEELSKLTLRSIAEASTPVNEDKLKDIATISANNDSYIGGLIADAFNKVGKEGILTVEDSRTNETYVKVVDGVSINRGWLSPYFMTDRDKLEAVYEDAYVLVTDKKIRSTQEIVPIVDKCFREGKPLLIIADDVEAQALALLVMNRLRNNAPVVAIKAPAYGDRRAELLHDLSVITGGELVTEDRGMQLEDTTLSQLGKVKKLVVGQNETVLVDPAGDKEQIAKRASEVRSALEKADNSYIIEKLTERLAKLVAKVAVLYVGAATETEVKEIKDRVDDAIRATRAAIAKGFVPGGGTTLLDTSDRLESANKSDASVLVFKNALQQPVRKIAENAGEDPDKVVEKLLKDLRSNNSKVGFNAATLRFEKDMVKAGVIDPTLVVEEELINAVSAANMLILSEVTIHDTQEKYQPMDPNAVGGNPYDM